MKIYCVIPAFNEEKTIGKIIAAALKHVDQVVVVDDASKDKTLSIAKDFGVEILPLGTNLGYQNAVLSGLKYAKNSGATYAVTFDADGQHKTEDLARIVDICRKGKEDLIAGVRPRGARLAERVFGFFGYVFFGMLDPLSGLKAYRCSTLTDRDFNTRSETVNTRICFRLSTEAFRVCQININVDERADSSRFGGILKANLRLFRALLIVALIRC